MKFEDVHEIESIVQDVCHEIGSDAIPVMFSLAHDTVDIDISYCRTDDLVRLLSMIKQRMADASLPYEVNYSGGAMDGMLHVSRRSDAVRPDMQCEGSRQGVET